MSRILALRSTIPGEPGDRLVDADIFRPSTPKNTRVKWYLEETAEENHFQVVGGCPTGLDLHCHGDIVLMKTITGNPMYSHFLIGIAKG